MSQQFLNDNIQVNAPKHIDWRYSKFASGMAVPWASTTEVLQKIPKEYRYIGLTVLIATQTTPKEYWFYPDVENGSLILKSSSGSGDIISKNFVVNTPGRTWGKYNPGDTIPSMGKTFEEFIDDVLTQTVPPTYTTPAASLNAVPSVSGTIEIGATINVSLTGAFNQNDGGTVTSTTVRRDGTTISSSSPYTDTAVPITATPKVYQITYAYGQGPIKNNNLGQPDATGRINAGSVQSNTVSFRGYYKIFYDVTSIPISSIGVRAGANSRFQNDSNNFILNTGNTSTTFWLWVPAGKTLVSVVDLDSLSVDITSQYIQSFLPVNDAAGNPVSGNLYGMTQTVPYSTNHRHSITLA